MHDIHEYSSEIPRSLYRLPQLAVLLGIFIITAVMCLITGHIATLIFGASLALVLWLLTLRLCASGTIYRLRIKSEGLQIIAVTGEVMLDSTWDQIEHCRLINGDIILRSAKGAYYIVPGFFPKIGEIDEVIHKRSTEFVPPWYRTPIVESTAGRVLVFIALILSVVFLLKSIIA